MLTLTSQNYMTCLIDKVCHELMRRYYRFCWAYATVNKMYKYMCLQNKQDKILGYVWGEFSIGLHSLQGALNLK